MPDAPEQTAIGPDVLRVAMDHARRGVNLQVALRGVLVAFVALTVVFVPPARDVFACVLVAAGYALWALAVFLWTRGGSDTPVRLAWVALLMDLLVIGSLTMLTGLSTPQSWTSDVFAAGFLLIPVLAATQLRATVCAAVAGATLAVFLVAAIVTQEANAEPWGSLLLRTMIVAGVGLGCVGLSRIQRSRVETIGSLVNDRTDLLDQLTGIEEHERRALSEALHDGALQYVLAARQDLEDARDTGDAASFDRIEEALLESSRLLRTTVSELHPAVLDRAGLTAALGDLVRTAAGRAGFVGEVSTDGWPDERTPLDGILYRTARELVGNAAKHASASTLRLSLTGSDGCARLVVADDGVGLPADAMTTSLRRGHIGLASHRVRIEAAGGTFTAAPAAEGGTVVAVQLPL
ncbi:MAG: ATP-binding protein [Pseudonocardia sp.]|uniref:sensor histidine kinase n=1 Tax=unclassified Pseudonocardia TaxID=2619320 RepID=UPI0008694718|nr:MULTISPECIES: ATP-binding protein [unclassified Pseudonocardia]MBN9109058.1 ATP-binding protein [Pseudonocardia sp.]ODU20933.1 MAG: ATPase [Pseudonocardia sp. SCN 72-51]ODV02560.1 MAG: ATPase [Pseudonocardia sp. SCN 73-27]